MKAPDFWRRNGLAAQVLAPCSWLFSAAGQIRSAIVQPYTSQLPVICVGNAVAGGAGKTPVAMQLARQLAAAGWRPALLSRGYGGREPGPHLVNMHDDAAALVGDEALLLAGVADTWVARDRAAGARAIEAGNYDLIIMDDGLQNPQLQKTIALLVVDTDQGFGNQRVLPAGPLREPIGAALARADAVITFGADNTALASTAFATNNLPSFSASLGSLNSAQFNRRRCLAFAGIGRPEKFRQSLAAAGAEIIDFISFPDHHRFTDNDTQRLLAHAADAEAVLVTTAKDHVRCPAAFRQKVEVLQVAPVWSDPEALLSWLQSRLQKSSP